MQDLTTGSIGRHLVKTTGFMLVMMVFQVLYFLVDLYWVGRLGTDAVAGVGIAGQVSFITLAIAQVLGVGTTALVAQATGRKDRAAARHAFNQAIVLSCVTGVLFVALAFAVMGAYTRAMAADAETARLATGYLRWYVPALAIQFPLGTMAAALRAVGDFRRPVLVSTASVLLNMALAPFLVFGWGTGHAFGVAGAAMSTLVPVTLATLLVATWFRRPDAFLRFDAQECRPVPAEWRRLLAIGLPAGFEFAMMALYQFVVYTVARPFGPAAQAGFGVGMRVIQAGFMPVVALGAAVAPVAGQNVGARQRERVIETFRTAAAMATAVMACFALLSHISPEAMVRPFSDDAAVIAMAAGYLRVVSWNYVASGLIFVASSMFQAMGNTLPALAASALRTVLVLGPVLWLAPRPGFRLEWVWTIAVAMTWLQTVVSLALLRREFRVRLGSFAPASPGAPTPAPLLAADA
jgi:putative MATE family efflux protein